MNATTTTTSLNKQEQKDLRVLALFTSVWCRAHHQAAVPDATPLPVELAGLGLERYPVCADCRAFLLYACQRRCKCPLDPKPSCKHCPLHCYRPGHREQVRAIMRFAGPYLIKRGRLDLLWHYFF